MAASLKSLKLTYGEGAMLDSIIHFLNFMRNQSAPLPTDRKELNTLLVAYVKQVRREQMQFVSDLRVSRGQEPLPKRLLL